MNIQNSKWYTTYTDEMKALKTAYSQANNIDQRSLYMFVMKKAKTDDEKNTKTIVGDMPRGKQFGFLFTEGVGNRDQLAKTIAHELGHGYFQLKHPFEMGLKQGDLKDNLMDYEQGVAFNKYEWDLMHDPGIVTGLFESDSSGQYAVATHFSITYDILKENGVNDKVAKKIAYYASVYADYLSTMGLTIGNIALAPIYGENPLNMLMDTKTYTASHDRTKNSQSIEYIDINGGYLYMVCWLGGKVIMKKLILTLSNYFYHVINIILQYLTKYLR